MSLLTLILTKINFIWSQQGSSSADTIADPAFVAWNIVQCRPNTQIRLDLTEPNANGVVVAADVFLVEESREHIFFSFRNKGTLALGFKVEIHTDKHVKLWRKVGPAWVNHVTSTTTLNLSKSTSCFIWSLTVTTK